MTPKEKAKELFTMFREVVKKQPDGTFTELNKAAKQCALIAVEEIIKSVPIAPLELSYPLYYWQEVKTEIQNL